jgi:hypothetical protein
VSDPEPETDTLIATLSELFSRKNCSKCGGPLGEPGTGRVRCFNFVPGTVLCENCYVDMMEQVAAESEAEYWRARAELEREFGA